MQQYLDLVRKLLEEGKYKEDRTGTGTYSVFGAQMRFNLSDGFPLLTTKHTHIKPIIHELLWFLKGETNIRYLKENGVNIWDQWVKPGTEEYRPMTDEEMKAAIIKADRKLGSNPDREYKFTQLEEDNPILCEICCSPNDNFIEIKYKQQGGLEEIYSGLHGGKEPRVLIAGELGPVYGSQWRSWPNPKIELIEDQEEKARYMASGLTYVDWLASGQAKAHVKNESIDQISNLIETLKKNPDSRRLIVSAWNPAEVDNMALPPCHSLFQFYSCDRDWSDIVVDLINSDVVIDDEYAIDHHRRVTEDMKSLIWVNGWEKAENGEGYRHPDYHKVSFEIAQKYGIPTRKLSCQLYQRSADTFIGLPYNIASYSLLTMMIAQVTNHVPGDFVWTGGDCHLYSNHIEQTKLMLNGESYPFPIMTLNPEIKDIFDFKYEDFTLKNYKSNPHIPAPVAV